MTKPKFPKSSSLPSLPAECVNWSDYDLGSALLGLWIVGVAEKQGIPSDQIPQDFANATLFELTEVEANSAKNTAIEKALHKAASGDFVSAGKLIREHIQDGAESIANTNLVDQLHKVIETIAPDANYGRKMREGPKKRRRDALHREMKRGIEEFETEYGTQPEKNQLLEWLDPDQGGNSDIVQEINWEEKKIYWNGRDDPTSFKSFANRLTKIRKPSQKNTPG